MKKIITIVLVIISVAGTAQVAIGKAEISKLADNVTPNPSISLEFANTEPRGLILPYITDKSGITENGTIIYDTSDHKVKYLKDGVWTSLSNDDNTAATIGMANTVIQDTKTELSTAKTAIGTNGSTDVTPGILVLTDTNKAMILPKVASPHLNIIDPAPGMMAYDTVKKQLAVYNGTSWSFWKP
jgi:hypothetical protein